MHYRESITALFALEIRAAIVLAARLNLKKTCGHEFGAG
jgi:hypothetical protein